MNSKSAVIRPLRLCRNCRSPFLPDRASHAFCQAACRKASHRLRHLNKPAAGASDRLLGELHSVQESAGVLQSVPHPYLRCFAEIKFVEQQAKAAQRRLAQLRRDLSTLPDPSLRLRVFHLHSPDSALESVELSDRWVGVFATEEAAVMVLGSARAS